MNIPTEFKSYIVDTINLSRSMVIKSSMIAQYINNWMSALNNNPNLDEEPLSEWKYYVNLSGNYYSSPGYSDTPMMIQSLDTGNTILFSPENLNNNPVTQENYYPGSFFYNQLVTLYPLQQDLILSIIYPTDINTAINSNDGTLLGYNSSLVEPQEYTLISKLQTWIYGFEFRWNVKGYSVSDEYYPAAYRSILYNQIVNKLLNLRLLNCKTPEANSFHIRQYLDSNNDLGQYIPYLSLEQQLYLYRNISNFRLKSGYKSVFKNLLNYIAIPSKVNIYGVDLVKASSSSVNPPLSSFKLTAINDIDNVNNYNDNIILNGSNLSLNDILSLESPLTANNPHYIDKYSTLISDKTQYTLDNSYDTKMLYSTNVNTTTPYAFSLSSIIYNELIYLSYKQVYTAIALLEYESNNFYYLTAIDTVYLLRYLAGNYYNVNMIDLPTLYCRDVLRLNTPTFEQASSVVDYSSPVWDKLKDIYNDIVNMLPSQTTLTNINNINSFYNYCETIFELKKKMFYYTASINNANDRAYMSSFFKQFFSNYSLPPVKTQSYTSWLLSIGVDTTSFTTEEYSSLYSKVLTSITTLSQDTLVTYTETVNAIIAIIKSLTSYTLQYIVDIVSDIETVGDKIISVYNLNNLYSHEFFYKISTLVGEIIYPDMYRVNNLFKNIQEYSVATTVTVNGDLSNLGNLTQDQLKVFLTLP